MAHVPTEIRSHARSHALSALRTLAGIMANSESDTARVNAATEILNRAYGRAPQAITGENGEGGIEVIIRHIVDTGRENTRVIDVSPVTKLDHSSKQNGTE